MDKTIRPVPREAESRETFQRAAQWAPAGLIPEFVKKVGWAYRWVRTSMAGQADAMNVSSKMREGWEPVKPAEHPEMQLFTGDSRHSDSIEVGGLMLMKTPEEFVAQRAAHYNKATQAQAEAVNNNFMKENDARMPLFQEKKSTTTFGKK